MKSLLTKLLCKIFGHRYYIIDTVYSLTDAKITYACKTCGKLMCITDHHINLFPIN